MEGGVGIVRTVEEFLLILSPERKAQILPKLQALIDRNLAHQKTIVLQSNNSISESFTIDKNSCQPTNYYVISDKIGEGGMGTVYRALDVQLERYVALKILKKSDEELLERFVRERKITAELDHPNFVRILTSGYMDTQEGKLPFYTMPLILGNTLEELVRRRALPGEKGDKLRTEFTPTRLVQIVQQICLTLQSAHDKSIIHRDLKPSNIIVGPYGETYVMDLGLAKHIKDSQKQSGRLEAHVERQIRNKEDKDLTMDSGIGTPFYMAPEQVLTPQQVDHRTDIFGIGGILYYILTGQRPHYVLPLELKQFGIDSDSNDDFDFVSTMKECKIISPSRIVTQLREKLKKIHELGVRAYMPDSVDEALEAICVKAMRKNPEERYQSCNEMWEKLQQCVEGHPELVLEEEAKEYTKVMTKTNLDNALEGFEIAERKLQESIDKLAKIKRTAFEEKLKMIDLKIGKAAIYDQRGESKNLIDIFEEAKSLIEAPLNAAQRQYIRLHIMEGIAKFNQREYADAKSLQLKAIELCKSHPEKLLLVSAYHNYANACMYDFEKRRDLTDFSNAKKGFSECYKLSDKLVEEYKDRDPERLARAVTSAVRARTAFANLLLDDEESRDEARSTLESALEKASGNDSLLAEVNAILCWHYLKRKDYNNSIRHGELAVKLADNADGQINLNEARLALGQAYHHIANAEKRVQNLKLVLNFKYTREPLSYEDAVKEFYNTHKLDLSELI